MIGFSDDIANAVLDKVFGVGSGYTAPATMYLALVTQEPLPSDDGSTIVESDYGAYARVAVARADFTAAADRVKTSTSDVTFPMATADATADVGWVVLLTAATDGDIIMVGLVPAFDIVTGDQPVFEAGSLNLSLP